MGINLVDKTMTNSPCYKAKKLITPVGMYLHSIGCPCENANNIIKNENQENAGAAVQAVIQHDGQVLEGLPVYPESKKAIRNWHCGSGSKGSGNDTHIGVEMCEPETIKYTSGSSWVELADGSNTKAVVLANYKNAVEYFALRCKQFGFDPLKDGVVISHKEGYARGYASNHSDPEHIWSKFGLTMDQFRKDVRAKMDGGEITVTGTTTVTDTGSQKVTAMYGHLSVICSNGINVRKTPSFGNNVVKAVSKGTEFDIVGISADEKWYKTADGYYITTVPDYVKFNATAEQKASTAGTGYYRVRKAWNKADTQIGAFKNLENAIDMCKHNSGYYVYDNDGKQVYPAASSNSSGSSAVPSYVVGKKYTLQVELKVRTGAGTNYSPKKYSQLTDDGKKHDKDGDGALDKGTVVTCQEVKKNGSDIWIKCPSGWVAAYYEGEIYIK